MKIRYYLMALMVPFVTLLTHAAITGVSPMTTLGNMATAVSEAAADPSRCRGRGWATSPTPRRNCSSRCR